MKENIVENTGASTVETTTTTHQRISNLERRFREEIVGDAG
jgi:hypothetical protein